MKAWSRHPNPSASKMTTLPFSLPAQDLKAIGTSTILQSGIKDMQILFPGGENALTPTIGDAAAASREMR